MGTSRPRGPHSQEIFRFSFLKPGATEIWFPRERTLTIIRPNSGRTYYVYPIIIRLNSGHTYYIYSFNLDIIGYNMYARYIFSWLMYVFKALERLLGWI